MKRSNTLLLMLAAISFNGCVLFSSSMVSSGATGTDGLSGTLVDDQGVPVINALVIAYATDTASAVLAKIAVSTDSSADSAVDSTWTDGKGRFKFSHLKHGDYNLKGKVRKGDSTRVVCRNEVHFDGSLELGRDTVKAPGIILIRALSEGRLLQGVRCSVIDASIAAVSDDSGRCLLAEVPPGVFHIRMVKNGFSPAVSGEVRVHSDKITYADPVTLVRLPSKILNTCWDFHQSNDFSGLLVFHGDGKQITDTIYTLNDRNGDRFLSLGSGTDSSSHIYFAVHFIFPPGLAYPYDTTLTGYYRADLRGDSLVNGTTQSNHGDHATWYATRTDCPH